MDEHDDDWDDYIDGALFAINTNVSTTTKCTPFFVMFGRHPRLPFEVEKFVKPFEDGDGEIDNLITELCSDDSLKERINKMTETRNAIFPAIEKNITIAQQKQTQQYLKRTGGAKFTFKNGDTVLRRNMLQKTSKGHKMEDQWMGPYTTEEVDLEKGTCKLRAKSGKLLQRKINLKDLKLYREQSTPQTPQNDAVQQPSPPTAQPGGQAIQRAIPPASQTGRAAVKQPTPPTSQMGGATVKQPTPPTSQMGGAAVTQPTPPTSQMGGATVKQPTPPTSQMGGATVKQPTPPTRQMGGVAVTQPTPPTSQMGGATVKQPTPSTSQMGGAAVCQPNPLTTGTQPCRKAVRQATPPSSDILTLVRQLKAVTEEDIIASFNEVILDTLSSILNGSKNSWQYNVYRGKASLGVDERFDKNDLKFNVPFGDFDESQSYAMLELIAQHLPKVYSRCQTEVLLPEALIS